MDTSSRQHSSPRLSGPVESIRRGNSPDRSVRGVACHALSDFPDAILSFTAPYRRSLRGGIYAQEISQTRCIGIARDDLDGRQGRSDPALGPEALRQQQSRSQGEEYREADGVRRAVRLRHPDPGRWQWHHHRGAWPVRGGQGPWPWCGAHRGGGSPVRGRGAGAAHRGQQAGGPVGLERGGAADRVCRADGPWPRGHAGLRPRDHRLRAARDRPHHRRGGAGGA